MDDKKLDLEILKSKTDLINKKLLAFLVIAGGSWTFGSKDGFTSALSIFSLIIFFLGILGIFNSFLKLGKIEQEMENLRNGY